MRKSARYAAVFLAAAMTMTLLAGCGQSSNNTASTAAASTEAASESVDAGPAPSESSPNESAVAPGEQKLREINVVLDWYPNALHSFIYDAIQKGYYAEEGLDVKVRFPANDNDALALVAAGKAEIGLYYEHDTIQAVANQGAHIKSIGAVVQSPLNIILSLKDKNITSPEDLVGKTIGYGGTALSEALVTTMMENVGADTSDVNMINVGFELMSSMTTDNVDATIGCLVNHEVPEMEKEGFEVNYFMVNGYGIPNYYEEIFLANDKMIEEEPEVLAAFLRASARGFEDFQNNTEECLQTLLDNQSEENFPLTPSVEEQSCQVLLPLMETADAKFLSQTAENWQNNIDWMYEAGLINKKVEVSDVMAEIEF
jgi:putative hydroxymethylpyrimidine transport system substrate-binding protein